MNNPLPVARAHTIKDKPEEKHWLVEGLWGDQAVGIIGGEPKCCKSFMALTLAVAISSGKPCLEQFPVSARGSVLLLPAEDSLSIVKDRLLGICASQGLSLSELPIYLITTPTLRLDVQTDRARLKETIEKIRPSLLILDPFVRLHAIDENTSGEVAKILAALRHIQRSYSCAVALVHHAKKGASKHRAGQALRGSSEFHAWGDSNLYLRRNGSEKLSLTVEHRAELSPDPIPLLLNTNKEKVHLAIDSRLPAHLTSSPTPEEMILDVLADKDAPLRLHDIRKQTQLRTNTVSETLRKLQKVGTVQKSVNGFSLAHSDNSL